MQFLFNCWITEDISNTMSKYSYDPAPISVPDSSRSLLIAIKAKVKKKKKVRTPGVLSFAFYKDIAFSKAR
jgi:hypothetical protein